jgi:hypothetical protein
MQLLAIRQIASGLERRWRQHAILNESGKTTLNAVFPLIAKAAHSMQMVSVDGLVPVCRNLRDAARRVAGDMRTKMFVPARASA